MRTKIKAAILSYINSIPINIIFRISIHINSLFSQLKSGTNNCRNILQVYSMENSHKETIWHHQQICYIFFPIYT